LPEISVVVPTRDRPAALEVCLQALDAQTVAERLEVVVVDDGSNDPDAVAGVVARHPAARVVRHDSPAGPATARNTGARAGSGAILCFTDDDCVAEPEWAERLAAAIEDGAAVVAGRTLPSGGALAEAAELIAFAPAAAEPFAPSNNLACRKELIEAIPFDTSYRLPAGEDRDWCARVAAAGHALRFEPTARLEHRQRLTTSTFLARQLRYGEAAYRFRRGQIAPVEFYAALLRRAFSRGPAVGALVAVAQVATAIGFTRASMTSRRGTRGAR
jgi:glycosyltransferase involved in cell wall biosynthesis